MRKLSDLTTDECLDVLCEITPHVASIVADEEIMAAIGKAAPKKDLTAAGTVMVATARVTKCIPLLVKTHRDDVYAILASVGGMTVEEIAKQNTIITLTQIRAVCKDKELLDFFKSWAHGDKAE